MERQASLKEACPPRAAWPPTAALGRAGPARRGRPRAPLPDPGRRPLPLRPRGARRGARARLLGRTEGGAPHAVAAAGRWPRRPAQARDRARPARPVEERRPPRGPARRLGCRRRRSRCHGVSSAPAMPPKASSTSLTDPEHRGMPNRPWSRTTGASHSRSSAIRSGGTARRSRRRKLPCSCRKDSSALRAAAGRPSPPSSLRTLRTLREHPPLRPPHPLRSPSPHRSYRTLETKRPATMPMSRPSAAASGPHRRPPRPPEGRSRAVTDFAIPLP